MSLKCQFHLHSIQVPLQKDSISFFLQFPLSFFKVSTILETRRQLLSVYITRTFTHTHTHTLLQRTDLATFPDERTRIHDLVLLVQHNAMEPLQVIGGIGTFKLLSKAKGGRRRQGKEGEEVRGGGEGGRGLGGIPP